MLAEADAQACISWASDATDDEARGTLVRLEGMQMEIAQARVNGVGRDEMIRKHLGLVEAVWAQIRPAPMEVRRAV